MASGNSSQSFRRYRVLMVAAAFLYPAWHLVDLVVAPGTEDGLVGRVVIGAACLIAAALVGRSEWLKRHVEWVAFALCCAIVTHNAYFVGVNALNLTYVISYTLVVFGLAISFESHALLVGFIMYTVAVTMFTGDGDATTRNIYYASAIMALVMSYLAFRDKLTLLGSVRKKNEELETAQLFLNNTAKLANIGGWSLTVDDQTLWWSDQTYLIHDVPVGSPLDVPNAIHFYAPEARPLIQEAVERAIKDQVPYDLELPLITAKGRRIWVRTIGKPLVQKGRTVSLFGAFQDITEQRRFKEEDRRLNELLTKVLDNIPHGIFAKNAKDDFRYILWNKGMENLLKVPAQAILGETDHSLFEPKEADRLKRVDQFVLDGKTLLDLPEEEVNTKAVRFPAHTMRVPIMDAAGEPSLVLGIIEDISDTKKREALIRDQQTQLLHASKMSTLGEMSGGVAHEINNPLTVIMGFAQKINLAIESGRLDPGELKRSADKIVNMTERIARIVKGLRTFAREASHDPFAQTKVSQVLEDTLELCRQRLVVAGIDLQLPDIPPELTVECRPVQISQVLLNLLNNAYDAIQDVGVKWIRIGVREYSESVELSVTDCGNGIPPEIADKILQPFFTTKGVGVGTGLGLSISKGIIESHRGRLYYDPSSAHTRFVVLLPKRQQGLKAA